MDIGFKIVGFPGALREPGEVLIRVRASGPSPRASLAFVPVTGARVELVAAVACAQTWRIGIHRGPQIELPTAAGPQMSGPPVMFTEFHFLLDACPAGRGSRRRTPMNVSLERDGKRLWPVDLATGAPMADDEVAVHGELLDLYLRP